MLKYIILGIGFMLLIEGLLYFFFTQKIKEMMKIIADLEVEKIKTISTVVIIIGACLIYFTIKIYDIS
jgi:uncharacterized protein YjeT (DUF2065 family)